MSVCVHFEREHIRTIGGSLCFWSSSGRWRGWPPFRWNGLGRGAWICLVSLSDRGRIAVDGLRVFVDEEEDEVEGGHGDCGCTVPPIIGRRRRRWPCALNKCIKCGAFMFIVTRKGLCLWCLGKSIIFYKEKSVSVCGCPVFNVQKKH